MSVINQVLNQLEQRGASQAPEQTMVRAVPQDKRQSALPLLAAGLALASGIAAWQWIQMHKPEAAAVGAMQRRPAAAEAPATASAVPASAVTGAPVVDEAPLAEMFLPASRLSFELGSVPLPSSLREPKKNSVESGGTEVSVVSAAPPAQTVRQSPPIAPPDARAAIQPSGGMSPMKRVSPAQQADAEFRKAVVAMQQGHVADAVAGYEAVLRLDAGHDAARQALVALLLESKRGADAGRVLQERLKNKPEHTGFAMLLARLQVEQGAVEQAAATLERSLPYADAQADYQAFFAALLQRQNRHKEAIIHYQIALQLVPDNGVWLMGYGISLQAAQRTDDARDAFRRALESRTLSSELQAFVQQKLRGL